MITVNRRTVSTILAIIVLVGAAWGMTRYQRSRKTAEWIVSLASTNQTQAMEDMNLLAEQGVGVAQRLRTSALAATGDAQWRAAQLMGEVGSAKDGPVLAELLSSESPVVRATAALSLGKIRATSAESSLSGLVANQTEDPQVRIAAARALALLGAKGSAGTLGQVLTEIGKLPEPKPGEAPPKTPPPDDKWELRAAIAPCLGAIAAPESVSALAQAVRPESEKVAEVRIAAAYALGDLTRLLTAEGEISQIVTALLGASRDENPGVRAAAIYSLSRVTTGASDLRESIRSRMQEAAADDGYWVREAAARRGM